ncbi:MAG: MFS transporter [Opitutaceae bacterium]|nr:MFS transporter [Opitutaceae bacterium]
MSTLVTLTKRQETGALATLTAIQFTHILDFMIMMPLGSQLMREFSLSPAAFSHLVAAYGVSAAVAGLISSLVLDRVSRRPALLWLYVGFAASTLFCALAPTAAILLVARSAAGTFGGVASSVLSAYIGDIIPPERRGRATGFVMTSFPIASVLGVPVSLTLATRFSWHAPFVFLAACSVVIWVFAWRILPHIPRAEGARMGREQFVGLFTHGVHLRALAVTASLVLAGNCIIPFLAPSLVSNVGLTEQQLPLVYLAGGLATLVSTPLVGRWSDAADKLHVIAWMSLLAGAVAFTITRLGPNPLWLAMVITALFMVGMSGRFGPCTAMVSNAIEARYRGGFMAINSSVQQAAAGAAQLLAGMLVTRDSSGRLVGLPTLGTLAVGMIALNLVLTWWLREAAPHAARTPPREAVVPIPEVD